MDFFASQDQARRSTKKLVVYFALAVACIVAAVYFVCLLVFAGLESRPRGAAPQFALWNSDIFFYSAMGTLAVIVFGSLYQISALSSGGSAVAESLGGRLLNPRSGDPHERKLLNIVEEMSIASGVPMPKVYVMDNEPGINAFAAGHTINDAAVAVTRGCLHTLTRDELQGVIGHEFSHILNGDMRINIRLMGIIFGIICLATIGRIMLHTRGRKNPLPLLGLGLILIGGMGVFFGRLIQAAVSRQREFLADASAVQFTRNPDGLASALKKIAAIGSQMESARAADACHMFFGSALRHSLFATHPPLEQRIKAIEPGWDGKLPRAIQAAVAESETPRRRQSSPLPPVIPFPSGRAAGFAGNTVRAQTVLPNLGNPTPLHLRYAEELRNSFPESVQDAAHDPEAARALVFTLLLSDDETTRTKQLDELARQTGAATVERIEALLPEVKPLATRARLPLVNLALPALRLMSPQEFVQFSRALKWLVESDRQIDLFEFVLLKALQRHLAPHFAPARPQAAQFYSAKALAPDLQVLLSALAYIGSSDAEVAARAFQSGAPHARAGEQPLRLLSRSDCGLNRIDAALNRLALAVPQIKKNMLAAAVQVVGADGIIQEREAELLRAVADTLDCPIPPLIPGEL